MVNRSKKRIPSPAGRNKVVVVVLVSLVLVTVLTAVFFLSQKGAVAGKAVLGPREGSEQGKKFINCNDVYDQQVTTQLWVNNAWSGSPRVGCCQSGTNFCIGRFSPENPPESHTEDYYCYAPGSIVYADQKYYCQPSFNRRINVWVYCDSEAAKGLLTDEGDFMCVHDSDYKWQQCIPDQDGTIQSGTAERGNFRCNGLIWQDCTSLLTATSPLLCSGTETIPCDAAHRYQVGGADNKYYCSFTPASSTYAWITCNDETAGEGVDNALYAERYNDDYVCTGTQWKPTANCNVCQNELPGQCTGSSKVSYNGDSAGNYYDDNYRDSNLIGTQIGCTGGTQECFFNGQNYQFDAAIIDRSHTYICGNNHNLLSCDAALIPKASDGGRWLCEKNTIGITGWTECSAITTGEQHGNYICSYDTATNKWRWFSEFTCSATQQYQLQDDDARICDGSNWLDCNNLAVNNPFINPTVNVSCSATSTVTVRERVCNNNIDDDRDGLMDCDDATDCSATLSYILNTQNQYEVVLKKGDCFNVDIGNDAAAPIIYSGLNVCDTGTEVFDNRVTLCHTGGTIPSLDSTAVLRNRFGQPATDTNGYAFLFEQGNPKKVSVMVFQDLSSLSDGLHLPLLSAAPNFATGQRIIIAVDDESYLLWNSAINSSTFSEGNLRVTHIATGIQYQAEIYTGTNVYVFHIPGDRLVQFTVDTENQEFIIKALAPGETPQAFPIPTNLNNRLEVTFSNSSPVRFIEPADLGIFDICRDDNPSDPQQVKVCQNNVLVFTLRAHDLTKRTISNNNYVFLFEVVNGKKQVSIFPLFTLSGTEITLTYDPFINAMVAGRRVAVEFQNKLYLLQHPVQGFISLPGITLTSYLDRVTTSFTAIGTEDLIDFFIPDGKITLQRQYGDPPPPFQISALQPEEIAPVDLDRDLSTTMSSQVPVQLLTPNLSVIHANDATYQLDEHVFRVVIHDVNQLLNYRVPFQPLVDASSRYPVLFYYHTVAPVGSELVKQVSIYRLYDLDTGRKARDYNTDFVRTFAGGKEMALLFGGQYYVVGYQNVQGPVQSFNINRLRLSTIDKTTTFPPVVENGVASFTIPNAGRIRVTIDYVANQFVFTPVTGAALLATGILGSHDFMAELTPTNTVAIGSSTLRLCFQAAYASTTSAEVCDDTTDPAINVPNTVVAPTALIIVGSDHYLLESNLQTGNNKKVIIRRIINIDSRINSANDDRTAWTHNDWFAFATEIIANHKPVFNISGLLTLPSATTSQLQAFGFGVYPTGPVQSLRTLRQVTPISFNGSIVVNDQIVLLQQQETINELAPVNITLTHRPYRYLPESAAQSIVVESAMGDQGPLVTSVDFVTVLEGNVFRLTVTPVAASNLVQVQVEQLTTDVPLPLLSRWFAEGDTKRLRLDGVLTEIKIDNVYDSINDQTPTRVSIKRVG